jgi:hypothetical protein
MKNDLLSQWNIDHKIWGTLRIIIREIYLIDIRFKLVSLILRILKLLVNLVDFTSIIQAKFDY